MRQEHLPSPLGAGNRGCCGIVAAWRQLMALWLAGLLPNMPALMPGGEAVWTMVEQGEGEAGLTGTQSNNRISIVKNK